MLIRSPGVAWAGVIIGFSLAATSGAQTRYATSDNQSNYVHWIDLYDAFNMRIDPNGDNPPPYSPEKTCGRCHDFNTISHGWHFNAVDPNANHGRSGQPWIWSDHRTGTHLPLSYRGWQGTYNPDLLGLSRWQVAAKFAGFLPGGGPGASESLSSQLAKQAAGASGEDRSQITGTLPIDCLLCHRNIGSSYSPFIWTEQIESQNFAYAPTAALGIGEVSGTLARLREFDPTAPDAASKLPKVAYDLDRFRADGKVFIDLIRKPSNNSCYYCHTNQAAESVAGERWLHDEDVHLRAGLSCVDCHRNAIDHQTVRGFEDEQHVAGSLVASFSCRGCHLETAANDSQPLARAGRLGAPKPAHRGLPPLHLEKMSCTACHSGPLPAAVVGRQINSIAHRLGEHVRRTGNEYPGIVGPVNLPIASATHDDAQAKYTPQRLMWPSFWGVIENGKVTPLNPEVAYELIRRPLKVRRDFTEELADVSLSLTQRKELLGEDRARVKEEDRTPEEQQKINTAEMAARELQVEERLLGALAAIEEKYAGQAVFISGGTGFVRYGEARAKALSAEELGNAAAPYAWALAHNVRPARQSLGVGGCTECHSDNSPFFNTEILPVGLLPTQKTEAFKANALQKVDVERLQNWNKLFAGRSSFKIASLIAFAATCIITLSALAWNIGSFWRRAT